MGKDLESCRSSIKELESDLSRRIETVREEAATTLEESKRDLVARVEELGKKTEALANLENRTEGAVAGLSRRLESVVTEGASRLETTERGLKEHLDELASKLAAVQLGLQKQMETSERLSSVLSNLASIFSGQASVAAVDSAEADLSDAAQKKERVIGFD